MNKQLHAAPSKPAMDSAVDGAGEEADPTVPLRVRDGRPGAFALFSTLCGYPMGSWLSDVDQLIGDERIRAHLHGQHGDAGQNLLKHLRKGLNQDDVAADYIDIFDRGKQSSSLYESEYGPARGVTKGTVLADIAGFYRAFGVDFGAEDLAHEMLDHVAVQLEFYSLLLLKQVLLAQAGDVEGAEIVQDARCKFLQDHLGRFVAAIASRPAVKDNPFYSLVFSCCSELVADECQLIDARPTLLQWAGQSDDSAEVSCGGAAASSLIPKIGRPGGR